MRALALVLMLVPMVALADDVAGPARVVDGDTLAIGRERVRLRNFNAPELYQPGGPAARDRLKRLVAGRMVVCLGKARDRYARLVALCSVDGRDLGRAMRAGP